jgi:hypothetical protein
MRYLKVIEAADTSEWRGKTWAAYEGETQRFSGSWFWCRVWCLLHGWGWPPVHGGA